MKNVKLLMTTTQVALRLEKSSDSVRRYERDGLLPAIRTAGGIRLFKRTDVERLRTKMDRERNGLGTLDKIEKESEAT